MNKIKIRETANALLNATLATRKRGLQLGYNQSTFGDADGYEDQTGNACGTVACIAGWVLALEGKNPIAIANREVSDVPELAQKILGLTNSQRRDLFGFAPYKASNKQAALVLFNLAETGKVDWEIARYLSA